MVAKSADTHEGGGTDDILDDDKKPVTKLGETLSKAKQTEQIEKAVKAKEEFEKINENRDNIFFFGTGKHLWKFSVNKRAWSKVVIEESSTWKGMIKHHSVVALIEQQRIIMTGGVNVITSAPLAQVFDFTLKNIRSGSKSSMKNMQHKRYGHQSVFMKDRIIVFGGFGHRDEPGEPPLTLCTCESLSLGNNYWDSISPMNITRAFFSACVMAEQYVYVFGGLSDYNILNSIEKYDTITDTWISLYFKMPMPLAKLGTCSMPDKKTIFIFGGMSADYEPCHHVFKLDLAMATF